MQTRRDRTEELAGARAADRGFPAEAAGPVIDSAALFAGRREITIHHEGSLYRMKITRQGKLILNK